MKRKLLGFISGIILGGACITVGFLLAIQLMNSGAEYTSLHLSFAQHEFIELVER